MSSRPERSEVDDCMDAEGRVTQGAVTERSYKLKGLSYGYNTELLCLYSY